MRSRVDDAAPDVILFLSGLNLILIQFLVIREFAGLVMGSELVILVVLAAYFAGHSLGYFVSDRLTPRRTAALALATLALHLTFPFGPRVAFTWIALHVSRPAALLALLAIGFVLVAGFYSTLLPQLMRRAGRPAALARCYGLEIAGALAGVGIVALALHQPPERLVAVYVGVLGAIAALALRRPRWTAPAALAAAGLYLGALAPLNDVATEYYYGALRRLPQPRLIETRYSPYTKIDVLDSGGVRHLYLNGNLNYGSSALAHFNVYLSGLPARLRPGGDVLILGSGSLASVELVAPHAASVTTVELDAAMARIGPAHFTPADRLERAPNWRLVVDDGKHFLAHATRRYDLIIVDVPAPAYIQTALLHTREFYQLARARLRPGGLLSVSLSDRFPDGGETGRRVLAGIRDAFPDFVVVTSETLARRSFALAGDAVAAERARLLEALGAFAPDRVTLLGADEARRRLAGTAALSATDLGLVLRLGWWKLQASSFP